MAYFCVVHLQQLSGHWSAQHIMFLQEIMVQCAPTAWCLNSRPLLWTFVFHFMTVSFVT